MGWFSSDKPKPVTPDPALSKGSTVDVIRNRGRSIDDQVDRMVKPQPTGAPIEYDNDTGRESDKK
jgi:hypothetical protein